MRSPYSVYAGTQLCLCVSRKPSRFGARLLHPRTRGVILHLLGAQSAADFVLRSRARAQAKPARLRGAAEPRREKPCPPKHDQRVSWVMQSRCTIFGNGPKLRCMPPGAESASVPYMRTFRMLPPSTGAWKVLIQQHPLAPQNVRFFSV